MGSKHCCSYKQLHTATNMAVDSCSLIFLLLIFLPPLVFLCPLHPLPGLEFPWGPKPFAEVVAGPLLRNNRQTTDSSSLEGHYVGVYFSAHWVRAADGKRGQRRPWVFFFFPFLFFSFYFSDLLSLLKHCDMGEKKGQRQQSRKRQSS